MVARIITILCVVLVTIASIAVLEPYTERESCPDVNRTKKLLDDQIKILTDKREDIDDSVSEILENFQNGTPQRQSCLDQLTTAQVNFNTRYNASAANLNELIDNIGKNKKKMDEGKASGDNAIGQLGSL